MRRPRFLAGVLGLTMAASALAASAQSTTYPNDPLFPHQWALQNTGLAGGVAGIDLDVVRAWSITHCSPDMKVAMLDTGVDPAQPDLAGKLLPGASFVPGVTSWSDDNGHGTQTAGVVGADTNNGIGVAGICADGKILPVKVADANGHTGDATGDLQVAQGIKWAVDQGARVLNLSLGTPDSAPMENAVSYAWSHNAILVAATPGGDVFPADYPHVLAVDGMDNKGQLDHNSTHGAQNLVIAPDAGILTTQMGGGYGVFCQCVSIAAPQVSGVAALILSVRPDLTADQVMRAIERGAVFLQGQETVNSVQGYGRVDAYRALRIAQKMPRFQLALHVEKRVVHGQQARVTGRTLRAARLSVVVTYANGKVATFSGRADKTGSFALSWQAGASRGRASLSCTAMLKSQGELEKTVHFTVR